MTILTPAAAMALALQCVGPSLAPVMVGIAQHESGLDTTIVHHNANGTVDVGLVQVNSTNFGWLGLTLQTAMDPCRNLAAGARVLLVKYNGNPPDVGKIAYASAVAARIHALDGSSVVAEDVTTTPEPTCHAQSWDVWAQQECREASTPTDPGEPE